MKRYSVDAYAAGEDVWAGSEVDPDGRWCLWEDVSAALAAARAEGLHAPTDAEVEAMARAWCNGDDGDDSPQAWRGYVETVRAALAVFLKARA